MLWIGHKGSLELTFITTICMHIYLTLIWTFTTPTIHEIYVHEGKQKNLVSCGWGGGGGVRSFSLFHVGFASSKIKLR